MIESKLCAQEDWNLPFFAEVAKKLALPDMVYHRKHWEHVMLYQALNERGFLEDGKLALGFACGREMLPAAFAVDGVRVLASDYFEPQTWGDQYSGCLDDLRHPGICPDDLFTEMVGYRHIDMNAVPDDLVGYDFIWSSCSFEHIGSLAKGLDFVIDSLKCVKSGGIAIHTTEYNLSSNDATVEAGSVNIYRRRDIDELEQRIADAGCRLVPINWERDESLEWNQYVDDEPWHPDHHINLKCEGFDCTSMLLIIEKP